MLALAVVLVLSLPVAAQRGRGGRGVDRPMDRRSYESADYGLKFPVPADMDLYTPDEPGMYRRVFTERRIVYLVNPMHPEESISIKYADHMTDADVASYKTVVDTNPPQARLPGFLKIGVMESPIGKDGAKRAVSFIYGMTTPRTGKAAELEMMLRQVVFVHQDRGFTITCETSKKRFDKVNAGTFDRFLSRIEFQ
jgi:hypothetical protein